MTPQAAVPDVDPQAPPFVVEWWHGVDQYAYAVMALLMLTVVLWFYLRDRWRDW